MTDHRLYVEKGEKLNCTSCRKVITAGEWATLHCNNSQDDELVTDVFCPTCAQNLS